MKRMIRSLFAVILGAGFAQGADVRYQVTHLQAEYGQEYVFRGISPNGTVTATSNTGYLTALGNDVRSFVYPFTNSSLQGTFGDTGVVYLERETGNSEATLRIEGIYSIDRGGNVTNTDYVPKGTSMFLGSQNSLGSIVGDEEGGSISSGSAGFVYSPTNGAQSYETLGGVNVTRFSAINDSNWIVGLGIGTTAQGGTVAGSYLWIPGQDGILMRQGADEVTGINNLGQVIGRDGSRGYFWDNGVTTLLGDVLVTDPVDSNIVRNATTFAGANAINGSGVVVGFAELRSVPGFVSPGQSGWIWSDAEGLMLLDDLIEPNSPFQIASGYGITDDGRVLARGFVDGFSGVQDFFLTPIPEPGSPLLIALVAGFVALGRRR